LPDKAAKPNNGGRES